MEMLVELFALAETLPADHIPGDRISGYRNSAPRLIRLLGLSGYVGNLINNLAS